MVGFWLIMGINGLAFVVSILAYWHSIRINRKQPAFFVGAGFGLIGIILAVCYGLSGADWFFLGGLVVGCASFVGTITPLAFDW